MDNKVALAYLLKMGGTCNSQLSKISKSIWNYLLSHQIIITAEYLPSRLKVKADWESRNVTKSSDCELLQKLFLKITKLLGAPSIDLFASRLCHQLPQHMAWKPVLQQIQCSRTGTKCLLSIPTFQLDRSGDTQGSLGECSSNDTSDTHMPDTILVYSPT